MDAVRGDENHARVAEPRLMSGCGAARVHSGLRSVTAPDLDRINREKANWTAGGSLCSAKPCLARYAAMSSSFQSQSLRLLQIASRSPRAGSHSSDTLRLKDRLMERLNVGRLQAESQPPVVHTDETQSPDYSLLRANPDSSCTRTQARLLWRPRSSRRDATAPSADHKPMRSLLTMDLCVALLVRGDSGKFPTD